MRNTILILLFISYLSSFGQKHSFVSYRTENGLIQSDVTTINQDDKGRLWVGTVSGLSIYDGVDFQNYTTEDSLAEEWITSIYSDSKSNHVWVGHYGGNLTLFNNRSNTFQAIQTNKLFGRSPIKKIEGNSKGDIYLLNENSQVFLMDQDSFEFKEIATDFETIFDLIFIQEMPCVIANSGAFAYENGDWKKLSDELYIRAVANQNESILCTESEVHQINSTGKNKFEVVRSWPIPKGKITSFDSKNGIHYVSYESGEIAIINDSGTQDLNAQFGLDLPNVSSIFIDNLDNLWIGSPLGLEMYFGKEFQQIDKEILKENVVWDVVQVNGKTLCATSKGVKVLDRNYNLITELENEYHINQIALLNDILCFGAESGKLFILTKELKPIKTVEFNSGITSLNFFENHEILVGTQSGLYALDVSKNKIDTIPLKEGQKYILDIHRNEATQKIEVSTNNGGVYNLLERKLIRKQGTEFIEGKLVFSITSKGNLSVYGTYGNGVYVTTNDSIHNFSRKDGLLSSSIYSLEICDSLLYIGSNSGLDILNINSQRIRSFKKQQGFNGIEVNHNSICKNDSSVLIGSLLGLVVHNPNSDGLKKFDPTLEILEIKSADEPIIPSLDRVFYSYDNNLTFDYQAYSPSQGSGFEYSSMLRPFQSKWINQEAERSVSYTNLKPGKYELLIKVTNAFGQEKQLMYDFEIQVPFYEKPWFFMAQLGVLLLLFIVAAFYGRRTKGSRMATIVATIAVIILFEWLLSIIESDIESYTRGVAFIKISLNVLLALILFPVEKIIKSALVKKQ